MERIFLFLVQNPKSDRQCLKFSVCRTGVFDAGFEAALQECAGTQGAPSALRAAMRDQLPASGLHGARRRRDGDSAVAAPREPAAVPRRDSRVRAVPRAAPAQRDGGGGAALRPAAGEHAALRHHTPHRPHVVQGLRDL